MSDSNQEFAAASTDWASPSHAHIVFFMFWAFLGIFLCYLIARPFLPSIVWAIGLTVLATPFQKRLEKRFGHSGLCSFACTIILAILVVIPVAISIQQIGVQAASGATLMETKIQTGEWRQVFADQPKLASLAQRIETQLDLPGIASSFSASMSELTFSLIKGSVYQLIEFGLTFYLMFFMLRDRELVLKGVSGFSPLTASQMATLFERINDTICATVYGSFAVAAIQGTALGLAFWMLGLPAPFFWGLMMACLALAPLAGACIVWAPAALFLATEGYWGKGILLVFVGLFVIVVVDNFLRPVLVGKQLKTHTTLVFISVVGGMLLFGASGILLGPIVLTTTQFLLELYNRKSVQGPYDSVLSGPVR